MQNSTITTTYGGLVTMAIQNVKQSLDYANDIHLKLSKKEKVALVEQIEKYEHRSYYKGVNFSRIQIDEVLKQHKSGELIEFETLGPYLINYIDSNGFMTKQNLTPEDAIGLKLARTFRVLFKDSRLVS